MNWPVLTATLENLTHFFSLPLRSLDIGQGGDTRDISRGKMGRTMPPEWKTDKKNTPSQGWYHQDTAGLTSLSGLPSRLLDVLLSLVAQLDLQLLGLHLQVLLTLCEGFAGLQGGRGTVGWRQPSPEKQFIRLQPGFRVLTPIHLCSSFPLMWMVVPWHRGARGLAPSWVFSPTLFQSHLPVTCQSLRPCCLYCDPKTTVFEAGETAQPLGTLVLAADRGFDF